MGRTDNIEQEMSTVQFSMGYIRNIDGHKSHQTYCAKHLPRPVDRLLTLL